MARPLILSLDGEEFSVQIRKIDREQLYGSVAVEAFDEKGNPASLMVLAADGKTLLDKGGTALATLDEKGNSVERPSLKTVDIEGREIEPVPSSFGTPNELRPASIEDYFSQIIKSVYLLSAVEDGSINLLLDNLSAGRIFSFPFSYRGGTEYDSAFVLGNGTDAFMVIGKQATFQFAKLNQAAVLDAIEEEEISGDDIDFDLF